jgi:WD40 repeat protein
LTFAAVDEKGVKVWNVNTGAVVWKQQGEGFFPGAVSPDGKRLLVGKGRDLRVYDMKTGLELWSATLDHVVVHTQWAPDSKHAFSADLAQDGVGRLTCWRLPD